LYRTQLLLKGFSYKDWEPETAFDIHLEICILELLKRDSSIEISRQILDVYKHARSEQHAAELVNQLKALYLIGYEEQESRRKKLEHDKFVRLMEEGIAISSVTKEGAVARMVTIDKHSGKPIG